jgi:hypothetical protein
MLCLSKAGVDGDERDRSDVVWQVRALAKAYAVVLHRWQLYVQAKQVLDVSTGAVENSGYWIRYGQDWSWE